MFCLPYFALARKITLNGDANACWSLAWLASTINTKHPNLDARLAMSGLGTVRGQPSLKSRCQMCLWCLFRSHGQTTSAPKALTLQFRDFRHGRHQIFGADSLWCEWAQSLVAKTRKCMMLRIMLPIKRWWSRSGGLVTVRNALWIPWRLASTSDVCASSSHNCLACTSRPHLQPWLWKHWVWLCAITCIRSQPAGYRALSFCRSLCPYFLHSGSSTRRVA